MRSTLARALTALFVLTLASASSRPAAAGAGTGAETDAGLRVDPRADIPITVAAGALWIGSELLKPKIGPKACRWCEPDGFDEAVRSHWRWSDPAEGDRDSNAVAFVATPLVVGVMESLAARLDDRGSNTGADLLVVLEATTLAADLNQVTKFSVARERPFVHALAPADKLSTPHPSDNNTSFFSGHTTLTFALAVSAGTVASMRGYRNAPWVWASGLALATGTGYLRIAADRHYFTDVATGALVGSAVGFAVPYFAHHDTAHDGAPASTAPIATIAPRRHGSPMFTLVWIW